MQSESPLLVSWVKMEEIKDKLENIFWKHVIPTDNCWIWIGHTDKDGYGSLMYLRRRHRVHRVSFFLHQGFLTEELCVLHLCNNRICCNPEHLYEGTKSQNAQDAIRAGTHNSLLVGEDKPGSKLTEKEVLEIQSLKGQYTPKEIAREFHVDLSTVSRIHNHETWKHLWKHI